MNAILNWWLIVVAAIVSRKRIVFLPDAENSTLHLGSRFSVVVGFTAGFRSTMFCDAASCLKSTNARHSPAAGKPHACTHRQQISLVQWH
jgi:hypothetical protein